MTWQRRIELGAVVRFEVHDDREGSRLVDGVVIEVVPRWTYASGLDDPPRARANGYVVQHAGGRDLFYASELVVLAP